MKKQQYIFAIVLCLGTHAFQDCCGETSQAGKPLANLIRIEPWIANDFGNFHCFSHEDWQGHDFSLPAISLRQRLLFFNALFEAGQCQSEPKFAYVPFVLKACCQKCDCNCCKETNGCAQEGENASGDDGVMYSSDEVFHKIVLGGCMGLVVVVIVAILVVAVLWLNRDRLPRY